MLLDNTKIAKMIFMQSREPDLPRVIS